MIQMSEVAHMYKLSKRNGHPETIKVLHGLLLHGLSNQQRRALTIMASNGPVRVMDVANEMGISKNNAHMTLTRLADYGLINYREVAQGARVAYEWHMPNGHKE